jgi:hypothetical protein
VQEYGPEFQAELASNKENLPAYVTQKFYEYFNRTPDQAITNFFAKDWHSVVMPNRETGRDDSSR